MMYRTNARKAQRDNGGGFGNEPMRISVAQNLQPALARARGEAERLRQEKALLARHNRYLLLEISRLQAASGGQHVMLGTEAAAATGGESEPLSVDMPELFQGTAEPHSPTQERPPRPPSAPPYSSSTALFASGDENCRSAGVACTAEATPGASPVRISPAPARRSARFLRCSSRCCCSTRARCAAEVDGIFT